MVKSTANPPPATSPTTVFSLGAVLVVVVVWAWQGALTVPFLLDDLFNIVANATVHHLGGLSDLLLTPDDSGLAGRPVLKLTFMLNYAVGGLNVRGYHLVNLAIHCTAGLTLFALARRTLLMPALRARFARDSLLLAFSIALLWVLHPVQTQAVTYVSQRAESLMGCFYLLTLYLFVRSCTAPNPVPFQIGAVAACLLGMGIKEVMVTAPLMVLLYDRTFVAGSFGAALRGRSRFYASLACTWSVLPFLMVGLGSRGAGFGLGIDSISYALTESRAVVKYLELAFFPYPLVFDYTATFAHQFAEVEGYVLGLVVLGGLTAFWLVRRPLWGFPGAWFFVVLAPTSSVVPVLQSPMAESRLYLPLAAVAASAVIGLYGLIGRKALGVALGAAAAFACLVIQRDQVYSSAESLWKDTVAKQPLNARAHGSLGVALIEEGHFDEAVPEFDTSLQLDPGVPAVEHLLANSLASLGRYDAAIVHYEHTLHLHPGETATRADLAQALLKAGHGDEALLEATLAVKQRPHDGIAHYTLGRVSEYRGDADAATASYRMALELEPDFLLARLSLGELLLAEKHFDDALRQFERAAADAPQQLDGHRGVIESLLAGGQAGRAQQYAADLARRFSASPDAHFLLGRTEIALGDSAAAAAALRRAVQLRPVFPEARALLATLPP